MTTKNIPMTYPINKQQLLLSLFLLLPTTTQCMQITNTITIVSQPKTIQELLTKRDLLILDIEKYHSTKLINNHFTDHRPKGRTILQSIEGHIADFLTYQQNRHNNEYSFLGIATIAINDLTSGQELSYLEKKEFIQKLLICGFKPTPYDKQLALVEQWERWQPIIKKICLLRCAHNNPTSFLAQVPCDVIQYISLFMLETEEALF